MPWTTGIARCGATEIAWESLGDGPPLLLVMGIGAQLTLWPDGLCRAFAARGFRVLRFDNRDVGKSSWYDHLGVPPLAPMLVRAALGLAVEAPYTLDHMADDAAALLAALGYANAHVLGASMGGMIAQTLAIRHPSRVRSLTSVMAAPGPTWMLRADPRALYVLAGRPTRDRDEVAARFVALYRTIGSKSRPFDEQVYRDYAYAAYDRAFHPEGNARQLRAIVASGGRERHLPGLKMPVLVLHGAEDPLVPVAGGRETARLIPGSRLHILPRMGHDLPDEHWEQIADLVAENAGLQGTRRPATETSRT
jgi:pimeloyl-ACP methyl ester carboxylesterase